MNVRRNLAVAHAACMAILLLSITACGGGISALNPAFQPQVTNQADNFQFQTTGVKSVTQTLHYTWQNSGMAASINQACAITSGSGTAMITLRDAKGIVQYSADLNANGTFTSLQGTPGAWTIDVALNNLSGTLNFRVQKM